MQISPPFCIHFVPRSLCVPGYLAHHTGASGGGRAQRTDRSTSQATGSQPRCCRGQIKTEYLRSTLRSINVMLIVRWLDRSERSTPSARFHRTLMHSYGISTATSMPCTAETQSSCYNSRMMYIRPSSLLQLLKKSSFWDQQRTLTPS